MHVGQVPDVGDEVAIDDEAEVEPVKVADHGDVETLPVSDDRDRELVTQHRPGEIQRLAGAGNVGDHQVDRLGNPVGQP